MDTTHMIHERGKMLESLSNIANTLCNCPSEGSINVDHHERGCAYWLAATGRPINDPWTRITADPETLPLNVWVILSLNRALLGKENINVKVRWDGREWATASGWVVQESFDGIPYAWQPWPDPAPMEGDK
jgi:hypothetical protein